MSLHNKILFGTLAFSVATSSMAQIAIGEWRDHFPYRKAVAVCEGDHGIAYCATRAAIFKFDPGSGELTRMTKVNVLNDVNIRTIAWNQTLHMLVVGYENGNLDLIREDRSDNLGDIERSNIIGDKGIYHIHFEGSTALLSCGFGIVVVDLAALEVRETWLIGPGGTQLQVNSVDVLGDSIYAATNSGLYSAWRLESNLASFTNWHKRLDAPNENGPFAAVRAWAGRLLLHWQSSLPDRDTLYRWDGTWSVMNNVLGATIKSIDVSPAQQMVVAATYSISWMDQDLAPLGYIDNYNGDFVLPAQAAYGPSGDVWIGDQRFGLARITAGQFLSDLIFPNGPTTTNALRMSMEKGALYVATGAVAGNWANQFLKDGVHHYVGGDWATSDRTNDPLMLGVNQFGAAVNDVLAVAVDPEDPDHAYAGSFDEGLLEFRGRHVETIINTSNSTLQADAADGTGTIVRVAGLDFDKDQNLWITNPNCDTPIAVRTASGSWRSFSPGSVLGGNNLISDIVAAEEGLKLKWIVRPRSNGLLVFNDNGTISDPNDDQYKVLNTYEGQGHLPSMDVYSVAEDHDGEVWLGTGRGVAVFYAPDAIFTGGDFDAQQILIEQDGNIQILLETEAVSAVAVDGADRKWLGTQTSGVFLVSPDGTEQLRHFTAENSPMPSNQVTSLALDAITGEVFIGTDQGIISYRSDATEGEDDASCASVFPNPVHPTYVGPISITGLVRDCDVRITDIAGNLVYHTTSLGGQAIWPGTDMNGQRVSTGMYMVLAAFSDGESTVKCNTRVLIAR